MFTALHGILTAMGVTYHLPSDHLPHDTSEHTLEEWKVELA